MPNREALPEIVIREAIAADTAAVADIFLTVRQQTFYWIDAHTFHLSDFEKQTEGERIFVAVIPTGDIVGFMAVWENARFIHHLFILPSYQRQGVGQQLVASLFAWLPLPYLLKCLVQNVTAQAFYNKNGWQQLEVGNMDGEEFILYELTEKSRIISPDHSRE
jgi:GNAT superfamily N-acetyltransferase